MTEATQEQTTDQAAAPAAKLPTPRPPKLQVTLEDGTVHPLLKYAFPVKAAKYPVYVNGAQVDAASTGGKGKQYTYVLINNTSFYLPGMLPVDAKLAVNFPEDYKFDDAQAVRVSSYKPKAKKADAPQTDAGAAADASASASAGGDAGTAASSESGPETDAAAAAPAGEKAARRSKR